MKFEDLQNGDIFLIKEAMGTPCQLLMNCSEKLITFPTTGPTSAIGFHEVPTSWYGKDVKVLPHLNKLINDVFKHYNAFEE